MDPDTFAPSDVIHLFVMEIDLDLSVGDPSGAAASDDDEGGEFSDEERAESFKKRGYIWPTSDGSHIDLGELPGYQYDANDSLIWFRPKRALECDNANQQRPAKQQAQASLMQLWKK
uniref:Uncharacterized protein n=1 Tax=Eutreptiella gymnastica TaxID=73025 RepID=A0A7S4G397_9EUGL